MAISACLRLLLVACCTGASPAETPLSDRYGDPLPAGALVRLGTTRLRHEAALRALCYSPDGKMLASGGYSGVVRLWDAATGREVRKLPAESSGTHSLAFTPDGKCLATLTANGRLSVWDVATGRELLDLPAEKMLGFPDRALAISPDGAWLAAGSPEKAISIWEIATGKETRRLAGHESAVRGLAFSPDGKVLASAGTTGTDGNIRLWDVATGKELPKLDAAAPFAFTPDGKGLVARTGSFALQLWDLASGKAVHEIVNQRGYPIYTVALSTDGRRLAWVDVKTNAICLWDTVARKEIRRLGGGVTGVIALAFAPDGKTLASGGHDRLVHLWNIETGQELNSWVSHRWMATSVAYFPDGRTVASASNQEVWLWDAVTGREIRSLQGAIALAIAPDGRTLATGSAGKDDYSVILWNPATGQELRRCVGHQHRVPSIAFSPDGRQLATGCWDATVRLWDPATGKELRQLRGHTGIIYLVAFTPDGKTLASSSFDKTIRLWDVATGRELRQLPTPPNGANGLAISPDGRWLAAGTTDRLIHLWDLATAKEVRQLTGHSGGIHALAFSPTGRHLVSGSYEGSIRCWGLLTGQECLPTRGDNFYVNAFAFAPDGRTYVAASSDTTATIWDATGRRLTKQWTAPERESFWADLAGADAIKANTATWALADEPGVALLKVRLRPAAAVAAERLKQLLADLDSDQFATRMKAASEIELLGELAAPALREALKSEQPLEVRRRLEHLLAVAEDPARSPERLRALRAVGTLEQAGTPEARYLLAALAEGAEGSRLTQDARAALGRLNIKLR